ncbi:uncharacterized protein PgNI_01454 [Pyricularia grisea]|uniref:Uncharacterized protein n=1 Tax=Pyricularia grisea TaxID=148305 RepID=A0A6P8BGS7_PYRGI|nr:uncharacterized protein PgNI_01454 [Pyricularia grisea]TLD15983.1 hypothetical protein PgNI_01454 [Pyricularia grisea]
MCDADDVIQLIVQPWTLDSSTRHTIVDSPCRGMCETSTSRARLNDLASGPRPYPLQDIAVVWSIHDLRPVRQTHGPQLRARRQDVDESARRGNGLLGPGLLLALRRGALLVGLTGLWLCFVLAITLALLLLRFTTPGARVDF